MKLAESWVEDTPTGVTSEGFHDEVEELDELDEAEDGCGGVVWQPYVLKEHHSSNKMLHEFAREVKGVEKKRGNKFNTAQYVAIYRPWEFASRPFLRPGHDYFVEFLAKLNSVTVPKGETLQAAFERAKRKEPPLKVLMIRVEGVRLLASLCRELQEIAGDQPFMLCQGPSSEIVRAFIAPEHLQLDPGINNTRNFEAGRTCDSASKSRKICIFGMIVKCLQAG